MLCLVAQLCLLLCEPVDCSPPGSSVHGDSPGKNTGVGCHALLQGIFPTQGSNPGTTREASHRFGGLVIFPNVGEVAFCRRGPVCPGSAIPAGHQSDPCTLGVPLLSAAASFTSDALTPVGSLPGWLPVLMVATPCLVWRLLAYCAEVGRARFWSGSLWDQSECF